jgi:Fe-Mn family superoxide dismutase
MKDLPVEEIIRRAAASPANRKLYNNAAQAWNHAFFWNCMTPNAVQPTGAVAQALTSEFGGLDGARKQFVEEGVAHFGSGWVWLAVRGGRPCIFSTHDADNVVTRDVTALLVCDLWEHAYYLDHTNDREGFLEAWWDELANWDFAAQQFTAASAAAPGWVYPQPAPVS